MGWMWVWLALIVAGLAILGYLAVRLVHGGPGASATGSLPSGSAARQILDERYARGEIDDQDYRRCRDELR